jgi:hypothetical protein
MDPMDPRELFFGILEPFVPPTLENPKENQLSFGDIGYGLKQCEGKSRPMVFDWDKAATLIKQRKPNQAIAGLDGDLNFTAGTIYEDGKIDDTSYVYLKSLWAIPVLIMDGEKQHCWLYEDESHADWSKDAEDKWPASARKIIEEGTN